MPTSTKKIHPLIQKFKNTIEWLETADIPFVYFLLTFLFAATLRNFFETYFNGEIRSETLALDLLHYYASYACLAAALIIVFYHMTKESVVKIARIVLPFFLILIVPPILSLAVPSWRNYSIGYMFPDQHSNLLVRFFTFFGPSDLSGITPGMRVEIAIVVTASFFYALAKGQTALKSILFGFLIYSTIFVYCAVPFLFDAFMGILGLKHSLLLPAMTNFYFLLMLLFGAWLSYLCRKTYFLEILKDCRPLRFLHFVLMFFFGIVLSEITYGKPTQLTEDTFFHLIFIPAAIFFAWIYSVMTNNLADGDIDTVSNTKRPTVTMAIPLKRYRQLSWIFLALALAYSAIVNFNTFFLIVLFIGNYFLYSAPPVRFKRVPFVSKLVISLNSLIIILLGHLFQSNDFELPLSVVVFFLVCMTAVINFIDIKDYEGDKKAGIRTLPALLGLETSKKWIGLFFVIAYASAPFALHLPRFFLLMLGIGIIQYVLINRKKYSETPVFALYLASILALIILLRKTFLF